MGYVAAKHPLAELVVVANDKGYDPMIAHASLLGFAVKRVGYKVKPAPIVKGACTEKAVALKVPASVKNAATPAAPPKVIAKKASVKKVVAAKVPAVRVLAKKGIAKSAIPQQAVAKKVVRKPPIKKAPTPAKAKPLAAVSAAASNLEAKTLARIRKGFTKMGNKAPHKLKPFLRHVGALLGEGSTAEQIDAVVAKLQAAGVVRVVGDLVLYSNGL